MTRAARLRAGKQWLARYEGQDPVRGYRKWFGVGGVCAVLELRMLGVELSDARLEQARRDEQARAAQRARRNEKHAAASPMDSDGDFAFIAGYTEGGGPFGIPRDEWGERDAG